MVFVMCWDQTVRNTSEMF